MSYLNQAEYILSTPADEAVTAIIQLLLPQGKNSAAMCRHFIFMHSSSSDISSIAAVNIKCSKTVTVAAY